MITHFPVTKGKYSGRIMEVRSNKGTIEMRYEGNTVWGKMHAKSMGAKITVWSQLRGKPGDVVIDGPAYYNLIAKTKGLSLNVL